MLDGGVETITQHRAQVRRFAAWRWYARPAGPEEMDLTKRIRNCLIVALLPALLAVPAFAAPASAANDPLLPDLRTVRTGNETSDWLELRDRGRNKLALRIGSTVANKGNGPLELTSGPVTQQCIDRGQYDTQPNNDHEAIQNIYGDGDGDGVFERGIDVAQQETVSCFEYHPKHSHWHIQDFSQFLLTDMAGNTVAGPSEKIGFCLADAAGRLFPALPGSPAAPYYPFHGGGCRGNDPDPDAPLLMGISIGYGDVYAKELPGQRLNVTGVPKGNYCLVSTANPDHSVEEPPQPDPMQLVETSENNNARSRELRINPNKGIVRDLGRC